MDKSDWMPDSKSNDNPVNTPRDDAPSTRRRRGFACMDGALQRAISSKGGKAAHAKGKAHEFTAEEAREAGRKGGHSVSRNREHMARIGREGGKARGRAQQERKARAAAE
ncbi:MAG: KGG domain-containing protein [Myxococcales bacterium]|nr:stress-induced protein [Polyangiaceae bacterium]MDW8251392.1 KGG domain-containing protein [Myxococcales bacterium]